MQHKQLKAMEMSEASPDMMRDIYINPNLDHS